jgi:hypothetical protein
MKRREFKGNAIDDEEKRNRIRTDHPLSVLDNLPLFRGKVRDDGRDEPQ